jgi:hypothetical protein
MACNPVKELESLVRDGNPPLVIWKGFASMGTMPFKGLQRIADLLDTAPIQSFPDAEGNGVCGAVQQ